MENLTKMQQLLLNTLKAFDKLCKENNIVYTAAFGTLLGAVRHHGFIPWDDDLDIFMMKEDYQKLLSLKDKINNPQYAVADFHDDCYPYPYAKFYSKECTFIEYKHFPYITGPWIDIFPLYEINDNQPLMHSLYQRMHNAFWKYRKSIARHTWREVTLDFTHLNLTEGVIKLVKKVRYAPFKNKYLSEIEQVLAEVESVQGDMIRCYSSVEHKKFDKALFESVINCPFEDIEIKIPSAYDEILRNAYGDYMKLPPVEKRTGGHPLYYSNYDRLMTKEEVEKIIASDNNKVKAMPLRIVIDEFLHRKGFK